VSLQAKVQAFHSSASSKALYPGSLPDSFLLSFRLGGKYRLGRDGESVLSAAVAAFRKTLDFTMRLGWTLVWLKRLDEAPGERRRASEPDPDQACVYAVEPLDASPPHTDRSSHSF
jgi:hypothetical protein